MTKRTEPPGPNAYRVTIMTRGVLQVRDDSFFSPNVPVIEPPEPPVAGGEDRPEDGR